MSARKIIVGYDRSAGAQAAAAWALDEADRTGASVEFFYAFEWPLWVPASTTIPATAAWPDAETDRAVRDGLDEAVAAARAGHPGAHAYPSIVNAPPALTLVDRSAGADLVVLGSAGHNAIAAIGSVSVAVTAHAHCPVVVVRGEPAPDAPVLVGVDDSDCAQLALAFAADQAAGRGTGLHILHARQPAVGLWENPEPVTEAIVAGEQGRLDELAAAWRGKYPDLPITADFRLDHPAHALLEAAAGAQLVVAGSRGRGAFRGMLLGSVSQHLLHRSPCTVAVVRELPGR